MWCKARSCITVKNRKKVNEIQETSNKPEEAVIQNKENIPTTTITEVSIDSLQKAAFVGVGLTAISVFMPMLRIVGLMDITIMD